MSKQAELKRRETKLAKLADNFQKTGLEIGAELYAIKQAGLWKSEASSWRAYLEHCVTDVMDLKMDRRHADRLLEAHIVAKKIGETSPQMSASHLTELARLAPTGKDDDRKKDVEAIPVGDIKRVIKKAEAAAKERGKNDGPSVRDIREAVKDDITPRGNAKPKPKPKKDESIFQREIDLGVYLKQQKMHLDGVMKDLGKIPSEAWDELTVRDQRLVRELAKTCDELAEFLRS